MNLEILDRKKTLNLEVQYAYCMFLHLLAVCAGTFGGNEHFQKSFIFNEESIVWRSAVARHKMSPKRLKN
jgi:hypothetical protein